MALHNRLLSCGVTVKNVILPVVKTDCFRVLSEAIQRSLPVAIISLGQSNRKQISLEKIATNRDHFRISDNAGNRIQNAPIVANGPDKYISTLPLKSLLKTLHAHEIPANISYSAGSFVCNHLFYKLQHHLREYPIPSGFIHLPQIPEQTLQSETPSMPLDKQVFAVQTIANGVWDSL